ncbi:MAG: zinc ribbon domain-containing protein [bacterium]|nr:zinc ribbon domain-containing protein [bacterium]
MAENTENKIPRITPSPLCDYLIEITRRLHDGETDAESYLALITERRQELDKARVSILEHLKKQPEAELERQEKNIEAIEFSFSELEKAYDAAEKFAQTGDEKAFAEADNIFRKVGTFGRLAFEAYQRTDIAAGPTEMPMVNALYRMKEQYFAKAVELSVFENLIYNISANASIAADDMEKEPDTSYQKNALVNMYRQFSKDAAAVKDAIPNGEAMVRAALEQLTDTGHDVRKAMEAYTMFRATEGPTKMKHANFVLTMAEKWKNGQLDKDVFARGLEVFRKSTDSTWREVESLASIPNQCSGLNEQMEVTREAYSRHFVAIDLFMRCIEGEEELYDEARSILIEAANKLAECKEAFDKMGERANKIPCIRCGTLNEPSNRSCANCGAHLFIPSGMNNETSTISFQEDGGSIQAAGELVITQNLLKIFETVNAAAEGRLTPEEYLGVMNWFQDLVEENLIKMPPEPPLDDSTLNEEEKAQLQRIVEQVAAGRKEIDAGAHGMYDAVERLKEYVNDNNSINLVEGVRELRDASIRVQKAAKEIADLVKECKKAAEGAGIAIESAEK